MMARNDRIRSCGHRRAAASASDDKNGSRKQNGSGGPIARTTAMTTATLRTGQKGGSGKVSDARERAPVAVPPPPPPPPIVGRVRLHLPRSTLREMASCDARRATDAMPGFSDWRPRGGWWTGAASRARPCPPREPAGGAAASRRPPGREIRASRRRFQSGRRRR